MEIWELIAVILYVSNKTTFLSNVEVAIECSVLIIEWVGIMNAQCIWIKGIFTFWCVRNAIRKFELISVIIKKKYFDCMKDQGTADLIWSFKRLLWSVWLRDVELNWLNSTAKVVRNVDKGIVLITDSVKIINVWDIHLQSWLIQITRPMLGNLNNVLWMWDQ